MWSRSARPSRLTIFRIGVAEVGRAEVIMLQLPDHARHGARADHPVAQDSNTLARSRKTQLRARL